MTPELTAEEQKRLSEIVETNIDWMIEQSLIHEIVVTEENEL